MKHKYYECPPNCNKIHCPFCEGGIKYCTVCKGGECELTTDCPLEELTEEILEQIGKGEMDFREGEWYIKDLKSGLFFRDIHITFDTPPEDKTVDTRRVPIVYLSDKEC